MITVKNLRTEYLDNPLAIDTYSPRFSWQIGDSERATYQSAYQIQVAKSLADLQSDISDLWNSGKVLSPQQLNIAYAGEPLPCQLPCYWRVRVWDQEDRVSDYSLPASFEIGILYPWQGKWIAANLEQKLEVRRPSQAPLRLNPPASMLQHKFQIKKTVHYARAYIAALGYCELYLNDHKVGNRVLDPAYSNYHKRN